MDKKNDLKMMFCLPGNNFSGAFLDCWTKSQRYLFNNGIYQIYSRNYSSNVYLARNLCLGGNVLRGKQQKPFNGEYDYDFMMWIDSDIIFEPEQIMKLIAHDKDIVSGIYRMEGGQYFATVREWDEDYFKKNGHFVFMTPSEVKDKSELISVAYTGFGFMLIKKGVFEKMEYPWFRPIFHNIGDLYDFSSEDVSFCLIAKQLGYDIYIDPTVRVGHKKEVQF